MSNENDSYTPISCDLHSQYELAIMHRTQLRVVWRDPNGQDHVCNLLPLDIKTERGAEFLIGQDHTGQPITLRLDRIVTARPTSTELI